MILLIGGTSETAPLATGIAQRGLRVLVSTATDIPLDCGRHEAIAVRRGALTEEQLESLIRRQGITAVVDAAHPYAVEVHRNAQTAAAQTGCRYIRFERPSSLDTAVRMHSAPTHEQAARRACSHHRPVLLTTGSRVLAPYVAAARAAGIRLYARVLNHPDSVEACRSAGLPAEAIITARGPFSVADTRELIRSLGVGVLVTKDSGAAGGVAEKLEAARLEECRVVVVQRPSETAREIYHEPATVVDALTRNGIASSQGQ